ncbi:DUF5131 family protein [Sinorhizobium chiapasense]|uniref:DUF5131 family protein n=1 Tax=Sinorhizobium chiapasense TaxID=501572 RepID=A0ABZ2BGR8_9HYPH
MAERSAIEWCDATVNFWWGCTKVSPGCDNCYAEDWNRFRGNGVWGLGAERRKIKGAVALIRRLQRSAANFRAVHGRTLRVFMQSMSDTFDNEVDDAWRAELFAEAEAADHLAIILLTKRGSNVAKMVPAHWLDGGWPKHIGLKFTMTDQIEAERDAERLAKLKKRLGIPWTGVSIEPMLGPINPRRLRVSRDLYFDALTGVYSVNPCRAHRPPAIPEPLPGLDWVIVGGESGKKARPLHPAWASNLRRQCRDTGTAFLFKQWGEWLPASAVDRDDMQCFRKVETIELPADPSPFAVMHLDIMTMYRVGKADAGRLLDSREFLEFPEALR